MSVLEWDKIGERYYETGVDRGVLYIPNTVGNYTTGFAWNGLVSVSESPSGAEATPMYADNIKYLNLISAEEFGATIEAYTYPDEFAQCDGSAAPTAGIAIGQQSRKTFGLAYRTRIGNDIDYTDHGFKLHLIYGALAAPTEKAYSTINDSPEAITFSWEVTTTAVNVPGFKPTATLTIDSTQVNATALTTLQTILYGTAGSDPRLPLPAEVIALFSGTITVVTPTMPAFNSATETITIPVIAGVIYTIDGVVVTGNVIITTDTIVSATPAMGKVFPPAVDTDWAYDYTP